MAFTTPEWTGYNIKELFGTNVESPIYVSYFAFDTLGLDGQTALNDFRLQIGNASAVPSLLAAINTAPMAPVPVPAAAWLFLSGLATLIGISRRKS